ncbi:GNAT family N-acetyltransferase [Agromyces bauzanensis]
MGKPHVVTLRATRDRDLDALFAFEQHEEAVRMAAFTAPDPTDRATFDAHWRRLLADPGVDARTVRADGEVVGSVARWFEHDEAEITCWVDPAHWGEGIATRAMRLFLDVLRDRPVRARVAADNAASIAVLEKLGFQRAGSAMSYANARGTEIEELVYRLD